MASTRTDAIKTLPLKYRENRVFIKGVMLKIAAARTDTITFVTAESIIDINLFLSLSIIVTSNSIVFNYML